MFDLFSDEEKNTIKYKFVELPEFDMKEFLGFE